MEGQMVRHRSVIVLALVLSSVMFGAAAPTGLPEAFYTAIRANDLTTLDRLIKQDATVNVRDAEGATPLMYAAAVGSHAADKLQATALHTAAVAADVETLRILLDAKVDVNARDAADFTPLMVAAASGSVEAVTLLLSRGAHVNDVSGTGEVIIHAPARV